MTTLRRPAGLLIDLSGTIHIEDKVIPGSIEAVRLLRHKKVPFLFVTNTTKVGAHQSPLCTQTSCISIINTYYFCQESQQSLWQRLERIGFDIRPEEIFSSLSAARQVVKSRQLRPLLLLSDSAMEVRSSSSFLKWFSMVFNVLKIGFF